MADSTAIEEAALALQTKQQLAHAIAEAQAAATVAEQKRKISALEAQIEEFQLQQTLQRNPTEMESALAGWIDHDGHNAGTVDTGNDTEKETETEYMKIRKMREESIEDNKIIVEKWQEARRLRTADAAAAVQVPQGLEDRKAIDDIQAKVRSKMFPQQRRQDRKEAHQRRTIGRTHYEELRDQGFGHDAAPSMVAKDPVPGRSLFEEYNEVMTSRNFQKVQEQQKLGDSLITKGLVREGNTLKAPEAYTQPFCDFLTENPTVFHAVDYFERKLGKAGFKKVCSPSPVALAWLMVVAL